MPDVQRPGDGERRGVDRVDLGPRPGPVEGVDLIGLPPSADEVDAFVKDESPEAWEKLRRSTGKGQP